MIAFLRIVGVGLIGLLAMVVLYWGWAWWLAWAMQAGEEYGPEWRGVAMGAGLVVTIAAGWAIYRLQDRVARRFDYRMGGRAPEDRIYCQRCGAEVARSAPVCGACGGTWLGVRKPRQGQPAE
ncbi:MAG TPA: hypothetical protein VFN74_03990 [Chloroflexota bacterium]|nr:hypothetical protein [Chloroflexota bacterium]